MYKKFYGLSRNPFDISPDPTFFYPTSHHCEALASLWVGTQWRKGFVVVTGEVGTGKTLLARYLFNLFTQKKIAFSYVFNPRLSTLEFLQFVVTDFGLPGSGKGKGELLVELNRFLVSRYQQGSTAVLVVDEAQLLTWELLEEIRLLTNLETAQQKLLQILLIGQPELDQKLDSMDLRQLKQRIALRCTLEPLTEEETRAYIRRRLARSGANSQADTIFPPRTTSVIHRYSRGIPRVINNLCEAALVEGFASKSPVITPELIHQVATEFRLLDSPPPTAQIAAAVRR